MRIIAGNFRGRPIAAPSGKDTRPTTDRVREALMSTLYSLRDGFEGAIVLDAFAGSGALAFEALSRGAAFALLCDSSRQAVALIEKNKASLHVENAQAKIACMDVLKKDPVPSAGPFDLVFLDPPYAYDAQTILGRVAAWEKKGIVSSDALIVYEHALNDVPDCEGFETCSSKHYGKTTIDVLRSARIAHSEPEGEL